VQDARAAIVTNQGARHSWNVSARLWGRRVLKLGVPGGSHGSCTTESWAEGRGRPMRVEVPGYVVGRGSVPEASGDSSFIHRCKR
jgi:hypothetical protein